MNTATLLNVVLATSLVIVCVRWAVSGASDTTGKQATTDTAQVVYNNIMTRTSVREYQDKPVENEKIDKLLHAAMAAPTAVNLQPWHFVVIKDKSTLNSIAELTPNARMAKGAPLAIVVCGDMTNETDYMIRKFWSQDASAATENILLQAHAMRLGAVWTGTYPDEKRCASVSKLLNLPDNLIPFCTVVIGYPKGSTMPKDKWKPENVTYESFKKCSVE